MPAKAAPKLLTADEVIEAPDLREEILEVEEWGGAVKVRGLAHETVHAIYAEFEAADGSVSDGAGMQLRLVQAGLVEPAFGEDQLGQLAKKSTGSITKVSAKVQELSGLTAEAVSEADKSFRTESS